MLRVLDEEGAPDAGRHALLLRRRRRSPGSCLDRGFLLSFAGTVTFKNAKTCGPRRPITPLDGLLVETDAPFLTPMPYRGRPNASYLIPLTVRALADVTGHDLDALCAAISANGTRAFGDWR